MIMVTESRGSPTPTPPEASKRYGAEKVIAVSAVCIIAIISLWLMAVVYIVGLATFAGMTGVFTPIGAGADLYAPYALGKAPAVNPSVTTILPPAAITIGNPNAPSWLQTNPIILGIANNQYIQEASNFVNGLVNFPIESYNMFATGANYIGTTYPGPSGSPPPSKYPIVSLFPTTTGASTIITDTTGITFPKPNQGGAISNAPLPAYIMQTTETRTPLTLSSQADTYVDKLFNIQPQSQSQYSGNIAAIQAIQGGGIKGIIPGIVGAGSALLGVAETHPVEIAEATAAFAAFNTATGGVNAGISALTGIDVNQNPIIKGAVFLSGCLVIVAVIGLSVLIAFLIWVHRQTEQPGGSPSGGASPLDNTKKRSD